MKHSWVKFLFQHSTVFDSVGLDLSGTPVAVFGLGDSVSYTDHFAGRHCRHPSFLI